MQFDLTVLETIPHLMGQKDKNVGLSSEVTPPPTARLAHGSTEDRWGDLTLESSVWLLTCHLISPGGKSPNQSRSHLQWNDTAQNPGRGGGRRIQPSSQACAQVSLPV